MGFPPTFNLWAQVAGRGVRNEGETAAVHVFWTLKDLQFFAQYRDEKHTWYENEQVLRNARLLFLFYTTPHCKHCWLNPPPLQNHARDFIFCVIFFCA